jgi:hypothetical protein
MAAAFAPPPPPPPGRRSPHVARIAVAVSILLVGLLAVVVVAKARNGGPGHPDKWDDRVLDLVKFDEKHRGLTYKHPVYIDFLTAEEYSKQTRTESTGLSDDAKAQLDQSAAQLRALGLVKGNVDLFSASNDLSDSGTLAFYNPDTERITVRGTEMTPGLRVTLAHELVHVLQDQYFDIGRGRESKFDTSQESSAFTAMVEGDAVRIENEYIDSLPTDEADSAVNDTTLQPDNHSLDQVPVALQAISQLPYVVGPASVQVLDAKGGNREIDAVIKDPPTTDRELLDPRALLAHEGTVPVDSPSLPDGVKETTDEGDFGSLAWYLVLAERIDPITALDAVDGWKGDSYIAYEKDGATCMALAFVGQDDGATTTMHDALDQWAKAMPAGAAQVAVDGDTLTVRSCDPGDAGTVNGRALDVIQLPALRIEAMQDAMANGGLDVDDAFSYGDCLAHHIPFDDLVAAGANGGDLPAELRQRIESSAQSCASSIGG